MSVASAKPRYSAPAAGCAADILLALARGDGDLSASELAERTGHTKSLVYRTLAELEPRRYVTKLDSGHYTLGLATVELGGAFALQMPLMSSVRRVCRWLATQTEETVNLGVLQGDQVLYLVREEGGRSVFALSAVGKLLPANAIALGKALLALKTDDEVRAICAPALQRGGQLTAITERTITRIEDLLSELARVRVAGYAQEHGEVVAGRCCMALTAPFGALEGRVVGISVSMDEARFDETREAVLQGLQEARDQIAREVRGRAAVGDEASGTDLMIAGISPMVTTHATHAASADSEAASAPPAISFRGVSKQYGDQTAVESLDLDINEGEFFCLLGPSGCGKTTTLNMIGGFVAASTGEIRIRGEVVNRTPPHRRKVNTVFQSYALFPHLNVRDNVAFGLRMAKIPSDQTDTRVLEALQLVALDTFADRYPAQLSGGQQQRVAVARALVNRPAVLLLDEPLGSLDLKLRKRLQVELSQIQREIGTTFVFVTHDQGEAMAMADRIAIMNEGRVEQIGTAAEIYKRPASRFVADFIGESNFIPVEWNEGVVTCSEEKIQLPSPARQGSGRGSLMVRPEAVRLTPAAPAESGLTGTVVKVSFLGSFARASIDCAAARGPVLVDMPTEMSEQVREGSSVQLRWEATAAVLFDHA